MGQNQLQKIDARVARWTFLIGLSIWSGVAGIFPFVVIPIVLIVVISIMAICALVAFFGTNLRSHDPEWQEQRVRDWWMSDKELARPLGEVDWLEFEGAVAKQLEASRDPWAKLDVADMLYRAERDMKIELPLPPAPDEPQPYSAGPPWPPVEVENSEGRVVASRSYKTDHRTESFLVGETVEEHVIPTSSHNWSGRTDLTELSSKAIGLFQIPAHQLGLSCSNYERHHIALYRDHLRNEIEIAVLKGRMTRQDADRAIRLLHER